MIKYRTVLSKIEAIEIKRETDKQVVLLNGSRENKASSWGNWHDTWGAAHAFLVADAERDVEMKKVRLEQAKGKLGHIKGMKPSN